MSIIWTQNSVVGSVLEGLLCVHYKMTHSFIHSFVHSFILLFKLFPVGSRIRMGIQNDYDTLPNFKKLMI